MAVVSATTGFTQHTYLTMVWKHGRGVWHTHEKAIRPRCRAKRSEAGMCRATVDAGK